MAHIRYYNFWDKMITKCEKRREALDHSYVKQIERSYKWNQITKEQYESLMNRVNACACAWLDRRIKQY